VQVAYGPVAEAPDTNSDIIKLRRTVDKQRLTIVTTVGSLSTPLVLIGKERARAQLYEKVCELVNENGDIEAKNAELQASITAIKTEHSEAIACLQAKIQQLVFGNQHSRLII